MQNVDLCYIMRNQLLRGRLTEFGHSLNKAWELKRQFSPQISSPHLDAIYKGAMVSGSIGGKLLGAGGGGFFLFFVPHQRRHQLVGFLSEKGLNVRPFRFEPDGLHAWTVRDNGPATESR